MRALAASERPTAQRYQRWRLLVWLWLLRMAAILCCAGRGATERQHAYRAVRNLILVRAVQLAAPIARRRKGGPPRRAPRVNILRAAFGSALRKRLRGGAAGQTVAALFRALQDIEALARHIVRRLLRGLTRLRPLRPRPAAARASDGAPGAIPCGADTS
ncbi:MAG: hypothetical protein KF700_07850 [Hyphomonadaceae bacterium]|nr:hypothetical protein [Hyphomonadaceae bacterium]